MPVDYYNLCGPAKQLNEIVVAGSHDAGITGGADNVQTQDLNIYDQAVAGVRVFDIRIAYASGAFRTYHGATKNPDAKSALGAYGEALRKILTDAQNFVTDGVHNNEFLILKFDKSEKWFYIAEGCVRLLGNCIYTGTGNLNTKTLQDLHGRVIVLFTMKGYKEVSKNYPPGSGILAIRDIEKAAYDPINFNGMQYCGKGGTNWKSGESANLKIQENIDTQTKKFRSGLGAGGDPDVIGMMYWTTTGALESIRDRNDVMWQKVHRRELKQMFRGGLAESIQDRIAKSVDPTNHAMGQVLKVFMPNIVMVDFADAYKCDKISKLNTLAGTEITNAFQALDQEVQQLQQTIANAKQTRGGRVKL